VSRPEPPEYVEGWGELIRAHRMLMGVSQRTLARRLQMTERSLSDIEVGRRNCPPGFLVALQAAAR
jgi:predicted transcriptional regulator